MKLLHVIATPRGSGSTTLQASERLIAGLRARVPDLEVDEVELFRHDLPAVAGENLETKYDLLAGRPVDPAAAESWREIERLIEHFLSADAYLLSVPMWNFSIPYALKYYIDCIVQPGHTFRYGEQGVVPLVVGRRMVCVTSRGSTYGPGQPFAPYDFQEPYLRAIFGFIGVTEIEFVHVQPADMGPALRAEALAQAFGSVDTLLDEGYLGGRTGDARELVADQA